MNSSELLSRLYKRTHEERHPLHFLEPATIGFSSRFQTNNGLCCCMFDYLQLYKEQEPTQDQRVVRNIFFDFKEGNNPGIFADLMAAAILEEPMLGFGADTILLTIPASAPEKHEKRFGRFSNLLAENLGIIDGFPLLEVTGDRKPVGKPTKSLVDCTVLNDPDNMLPGRNVLLVDDLYAKGVSFREMSRMLLTAGAKSVTGVFLAKSMRDDD